MLLARRRYREDGDAKLLGFLRFVPLGKGECFGQKGIYKDFFGVAGEFVIYGPLILFCFNVIDK